MYARLYLPRQSIIIEFGLYHLLMRIAVVCTSREIIKNGIEASLEMTGDTRERLLFFYFRIYFSQ